LSLVAVFSAVLTVSAQSVSLPELYVKDITLEKSEYKSGDTVSGSFVIFNSKEINVPDAYYEVMLVGDYLANGLAGVVYDRVLKGPVYVAGKEEKKITFTYILPPAIAGDKLGIQIGARTSAGIPLGWSDGFLKVTGGLPTLTISSTTVMVDGKNFGLQNGPTIYVNGTGKLSVVLSSNSSENISVTPKVAIYNRTVGTTLLSEVSLPVINIIAQKPQQNYNLNFDLPTFEYKAGVYAGRLDLVDAQGVKRAPSIDFRYIIAGDIFTIQSVSVDKEAVKKGEEVKLTVGFTGSTYDITTLKATGAEEADITIELFDQSGKSIANHTELVNFNKVQNQAFTLKAERDADTLAVKIVVSKNGKVLTTYNSVLSANFPVEEKGLSVWQISLYSILAVLIIAIFFLLLRKKNKNVITPVAMILVLFGMFGLANFTLAYTVTEDWKADASYYSPGITMSGPYENQQVTAGARFYTTGNTVTTFCDNDYQDVRITATLRGTTQTQSVYKQTQTGVLSGSVRVLTTQFSLGEFTAPTANGTYYIDLKVEAYHEGTLFARKQVAQPFIVISPKNLTATCPAPGTSATLSWIGGDGSASYALRVNNQSNAWNNLCDGGQLAGDICQSQAANNLTFAGVPGVTYNWWVHSISGNGTVGNPADGASFTCEIPSDPVVTCGNGILNAGEACDQGANNGACPKTCSASCTVNSCGGSNNCGNGVLNAGEACDQGANNGACPKTCSTSCTINNCSGPGGDPDDGSDGDGPDSSGPDEVLPDGNTYTPDPALDCTVNMTLPGLNLATTSVGFMTEWTLNSSACNSCNIYWKIYDRNGTTTPSDPQITGNILSIPFTTIGLKTIGVQIASTTPTRRYGECTATTTAVQSGGDIGEE
jgi:hypothetical protein